MAIVLIEDLGFRPHRQVSPGYGSVLGRVAGQPVVVSGPEGLRLELPLTTPYGAVSARFSGASELSPALLAAFRDLRWGESVLAEGRWSPEEPRRVLFADSLDSARLSAASRGPSTGPTRARDNGFRQAARARQATVREAEAAMVRLYRADRSHGEGSSEAFVHAVAEYGDQHPGLSRAVMAAAARRLATDLALDLAGPAVAAVVGDRGRTVGAMPVARAIKLERDGPGM